jgi:hypothetical protein
VWVSQQWFALKCPSIPSWTLPDVPTKAGIATHSHFVQTAQTKRLPPFDMTCLTCPQNHKHSARSFEGICSPVTAVKIDRYPWHWPYTPPASLPYIRPGISYTGLARAPRTIRVGPHRNIFDFVVSLNLRTKGQKVDPGTADLRQGISKQVQIPLQPWSDPRVGGSISMK